MAVQPTANRKQNFEVNIIYPDFSSIEKKHSDQLIEVNAMNEVCIGLWISEQFVTLYDQAKTEYKRNMEVEEKNEGITDKKKEHKEESIKTSIKKSKDLIQGEEKEKNKEKEKDKEKSKEQGGKKSAQPTQLNVFFSIYSSKEHMYVHLSKYNSSINTIKFPIDEIENRNSIQLKIRKIQTQTIQHDYDSMCKESKSNHRTKERKIGTIIMKVHEWRNLYYREGIPLEEAANKVGISKKSLDDYLLQLRYGKEHNYNFDNHKDEKVGDLRKFVKQQKEKEKQHKSKIKKAVFEVKESTKHSEDSHKIKKLE